MLIVALRELFFGADMLFYCIDAKGMVLRQAKKELWKASKFQESAKVMVLKQARKELRKGSKMFQERVCTHCWVMTLEEEGTKVFDRMHLCMVA